LKTGILADIFYEKQGVNFDICFTATHLQTFLFFLGC